jgi:hypothetical protein
MSLEQEINIINFYNTNIRIAINIILIIILLLLYYGSN